MNNLQQIKAVAFDIDGVLTAGTLIPLADGDLLRVVDAKDAFAIRVAKMRGLVTAIMSGGETTALRKRCLSIGIEEENLFLGCRGKLNVFNNFCLQHGLKAEEVAYFGDDVPDTQVLRACGLGIVPSDASDEAKEAADYICSHPGGHGAVREGITMILKAQGKWEFDPDKFSEIF